MAKHCSHMAGIREVTPSALGCEECLKIGSDWLHLRICRTCGHVGCCDDSPNKHATKHFHATGHPIIEGYDPPEGWGWGYVDKVLFDLSPPRHSILPQTSVTSLPWSKRGARHDAGSEPCKFYTAARRHQPGRHR